MTWRDRYAYHIGGLAHTTEVSSYEEPTEDGSDPDEWPYATVVTTYEAGAGMADDLRRAAGDVDQDAPVMIVEETISGGYSEYTPENDYPFTVKIGEWSKEFETLPELFRWLDEGESE